MAVREPLIAYDGSFMLGNGTRVLGSSGLGWDVCGHSKVVKDGVPVNKESLYMVRLHPGEGISAHVRASSYSCLVVAGTVRVQN